MSFRTSLLASIDQIRSISGPTALDIRTNQLTIRKRTWSGSVLREGTSTDEDLVLPARYPIRLLKEAEVSSTGGTYEVGDISVNHITPSNGAGTGYTQAQLDPPVTEDNVEIRYIISSTHPGDGLGHAGEYILIDCQTYRPFSFKLILRRKVP